MEMGDGVAEIDLHAPDYLYDQILKEIVGEEIRGKDHLLELMQSFAHAKREYDQVSGALQMVKQTGYGIAAPSVEDKIGRASCRERVEISEENGVIQKKK